MIVFSSSRAPQSPPHPPPPHAHQNRPGTIISIPGGEGAWEADGPSPVPSRPRGCGPGGNRPSLLLFGGEGGWASEYQGHARATHDTPSQIPARVGRSSARAPAIAPTQTPGGRGAD